jgi:hypothetical protein
MDGGCGVIDAIEVMQTLLLFSIAIGVVSHDPGKPATPGEMVALTLVFAAFVIAIIDIFT